MIKRIVIPPYYKYELSTFVINDNTVYIGHFGGSGTTVEEQLENNLKNLQKSLEEINLGLENVVKLTIILKNIKDFHKIHNIWIKYFTIENYPVRTTITSDFIDDSCLVQIDGIACYS